MMTAEELKKIKEILTEMLKEMTVSNFKVEISSLNSKEDGLDIIDLRVEMGEPQILIGKNGQTLREIQHVLRIILKKLLKKNVYLRLDINDYQNKKAEYIKNLARETAKEVISTQREKILPLMISAERRIVHMELSKDPNVVTESRGEGEERFIIIKPK